MARDQRLARDVRRLIASAQGGLADATDLTTIAKRRDLIAAARVQAECAIALAIQELADAVRALVATETTDGN